MTVTVCVGCWTVWGRVEGYLDDLRAAGMGIDDEGACPHCGDSVTEATSEEIEQWKER